MRGGVEVRLEGAGAPRAVRQAAAWGAQMVRLAQEPSGAIRVRLDSASLPLLRRAAHQEGCRVRRVRRLGLAPLAWAASRRPALWAGGLGFLLGMGTVGQMVWAVRVEGAPRALGEQVAHRAVALGVRPGVWRWSLDPDRLARRLEAAVPAISWAGVSLEGGLATVRVVPRLAPPAGGPPYLDLVAARSGRVVAVHRQQGTLLVAPGSWVERGQILALGALVAGPAEAGGPGPLHRVPAQAQVWVQFPVTARVRVDRRVPPQVRRGPWRWHLAWALAGWRGQWGPPPSGRGLRQVLVALAGRWGGVQGRLWLVRFRPMVRTTRRLSAAQALTRARALLAGRLVRLLGRSARLLQGRTQADVGPDQVTLVLRGEALADVAVPGGRGGPARKGRE